MTGLNGNSNDTTQTKQALPERNIAGHLAQRGVCNTGEVCHRKMLASRMDGVLAMAHCVQRLLQSDIFHAIMIMMI